MQEYFKSKKELQEMRKSNFFVFIFSKTLVKNESIVVFDPETNKLKNESDFELNKAEQIPLYRIKAKLNYEF